MPTPLAIAEPDVGSNLRGASGVSGVGVDADDDAIKVDCAGEQQRRIAESRTEVEGASHARCTSERGNQLHLRSSTVMEAAAVASLVDLASGPYRGEPTATSELHELHRSIVHPGATSAFSASASALTDHPNPRVVG